MSASAGVQTVVCSFNLHLSMLHHIGISLQIYGLRNISNVIQHLVPESAIRLDSFVLQDLGAYSQNRLLRKGKFFMQVGHRSSAVIGKYTILLNVQDQKNGPSFP